jgi:hypothetical protein
VNRDDFAPFEELLTVLSRPYEDRPNSRVMRQAPEPHPARASDVLRT